MQKIQVGDDVCAIGAPSSMAYTLTKGVISSKDRYVGKTRYIQTDAAINKGNSGGPLLDNNGCVIGINSMKLTDSEGIGLALTIDDVISILKENDIPLDEIGNISEVLSDPEKADNPKKRGNGEEDGSSDQNNTEADGSFIPVLSGMPFLTQILAAMLCVSVILNIVLLIMLIYQRHKNLKIKYNPKERTDFEIDILE